MNRLTEERIRSAYESTRWEPIAGAFTFGALGGCGCPAATVVKAETGRRINASMMVLTDTDEVADLLGVSKDYLQTFIDVYDESEPMMWWTKEGIEDGEMARVNFPPKSAEEILNAREARDRERDAARLLQAGETEPGQ